MTLNHPQRVDNPVIPAQAQAPAQTPAPAPANVGSRWDRVRWGPIWAGAIVALPVFLVLQALFFALGWLDLGLGSTGSSTAASIISGILALVAFFVGGLTAGASTVWRSTEDGLLHGVLVWALAITGIFIFALLGGGALLGPVARIATDLAHLQQLPALDPNFRLGQALHDARAPAGWSALVLGLSAASAALGGLVGAKTWPRRTGEIGSPVAQRRH